MPLKLVGAIDLPRSLSSGGFDHAAVCGERLYVAHTANDSVEVIDCALDRHLFSVPGLKGVAGVLASAEAQLIFTANRDEDSVAILPLGDERASRKVEVGRCPNGLAYATSRHLLLAANVGEDKQPGGKTATLIDVREPRVIANIDLPGRTRWAVFSERLQKFFINIADPSCIAVVDAEAPTRVSNVINVPAAGPHGLDVDDARLRIFCACDAAKLMCLDALSGALIAEVQLSGPPDTIFFNAERSHLYVAIGDPGVVDIVDTDKFRLIGTAITEKGAHTIGYDPKHGKVYAFLPASSRAMVFVADH
ncbi:MAG: hypothetical protein H0X13_12425 [Ramlibacter sp.]|nr:hypothetical protein [Ramlibacter sp.]